MKHTKAMGASMILALLMGCGQYVKYDGEAEGDDGAQNNTGTPMVSPTVGGPATASTTGGQTRVPVVEEMSHEVFGQLVMAFASRSQEKNAVVVDYVALSNDGAAMMKLEEYRASLARVDASTLKGRAQQQVYWYNAYNASVIAGVLKKFGGNTAGFRVIQGTFFSDRVYTFGGTTISLDQIENGVLRGEFGSAKVSTGTSAQVLDTITRWHQGVWGGETMDARFHAALNCGALGCPDLLIQAPGVYEADQLESQLGTVTTQWLASAQKGAGPAGVSKLFDWYKEDFKVDKGSVEAFVEAYRPGGKEGVEFGTYLEYDWTLNAP